MKKRNLTQKQVTALIVLLLMVLWEVLSLVAHLFGLSMVEQRIPYLHNVIAELVKNFPVLFAASLNTLITAAVGFLIGAAVGFAVSLIMSASLSAERVIFPYLIVLQMIPSLALAPIIFSIVKDQDRARIIISAFVTFFPVAVNTLGGMKSVMKERISLMRTYAAGKRQLYQKLIIPNSMPSFFTGLKLSAPRSVTAAILVEMLGTTKGIGIKMLYCLYYGERDANLFWACVIMAALLGIGAYALVTLIEKPVVYWRRSQ